MFKKLLKTIYTITLFFGYKSAMFFGKKRHRVVDSPNYQPLPWIGLEKSRRTKGTVERWKVMEKHIDEKSSFLDVGSNVGYFVFKAAEKKCFAWGIDPALECYLIANYARHKSKLDKANFFIGRIDSDNVHLLPKFDYVLFLSVFHHWTKNYGFFKAKETLAVLLGKAEKKFFFEMGQEEMTAEFNIPFMDSEPEQWITNLLKETSNNSPILSLGSFEVYVNKGKIRAKRYLFCVCRPNL